ncbi:MAG: hypothetical protein IIB21_04255 [Chloroflexi bacterium]|nr:hypothetical protein [Chloroflexota bacterium]
MQPKSIAAVFALATVVVAITIAVTQFARGGGPPTEAGPAALASPTESGPAAFVSEFVGQVPAIILDEMDERYPQAAQEWIISSISLTGSRVEYCRLAGEVMTDTAGRIIYVTSGDERLLGLTLFDPAVPAGDRPAFPVAASGTQPLVRYSGFAYIVEGDEPYAVAAFGLCRTIEEIVAEP